jgi:hypothetical protein
MDVDPGLSLIIIAVPNTAFKMIAPRVEDTGIVLVIAGHARGFYLIGDITGPRSVPSTR